MSVGGNSIILAFPEIKCLKEKLEAFQVLDFTSACALQQGGKGSFLVSAFLFLSLKGNNYENKK